MGIATGNIDLYSCLNPEITIFNQRGEKILEHVFPNDTCWIVGGDTDRLAMSKDGNGFSIMFKGGIVSFQH